MVTAILVLACQGMSQQLARQAYLGEDGQVLVREVVVNDSALDQKEEPRGQLEPWPKRIAAHPNFKSFRGATLADVDEDGAEEILVASYNRLYAFKGDGELLWSLTLTGTATYPPSIADVTGDGSLEVVQLTGGVPNNGRLYLIDAATGEVHQGWPLSFSNNWLLSAPTLADLDDSGTMEIIFGIRTLNHLHIVKADGTPFNEHWPVTLSSVPAFTPSVGDIDNDGNPDIIAAASNGTLYALDLNGQPLEGFPVQATGTGFSYQSPLLVDFDDDLQLSIVGANHGDSPQFFIRESNGAYRSGWPKAISSWTYAPPTVIRDPLSDEYQVFMSMPVGEEPAPMLWGYTPDGELLDNFPLTKSGGLESFISVADIDLDGAHDLIFGSNMMVEGQGFIHAWKTDGSGQMEGFPLRPDGFTFMNGANLGDVTGDGMLNLVAISYEQTFSPTDSTVINVWDLGIPVEEAAVLFGTYKGSNTRTGLIQEPEAEPVFVPFRLVNASVDLASVHVLLDGNPIFEFFDTGMASDSILVEVNKQFTLTVEDGLDKEIILSETLQIPEGPDGWLIVMAGKPGDEAHPLGFYVYENIRLGHLNNGLYDLLIFDAYTGAHELTYSFENVPDANGEDLGFGNFAGYYSMPFEEIEMSVTMNDAPSGDFIQTNTFDLAPHFGWGSAVHMLLLNFLPGQTGEATEYPYLLLIPEEEGMVIAPEIFMVSVNEPKPGLQARVFPNPAGGDFSLSLLAISPGQLEVSIIDLSGRILKIHQELVQQQGPFETIIPAANLKPGYYIVQAQLGGMSFNIPLMIGK